jgi:hypothetical protein
VTCAKAMLRQRVGPEDIETFRYRNDYRNVSIGAGAKRCRRHGGAGGNAHRRRPVEDTGCHERRRIKSSESSFQKEADAPALVSGGSDSSAPSSAVRRAGSPRTPSLRRPAHKGSLSAAWGAPGRAQRAASHPPRFGPRRRSLLGLRRRRPRLRRRRESARAPCASRAPAPFLVRRRARGSGVRA